MGVDFEKLLKSKEELEKELKKDDKEFSIKQEVKKYLPDPMKKMLDTQEGTYALIAIAIVLSFITVKIVGVAFNFLFRIVFILALIAAIYFSYVYFFSSS